MRFGPVPLGEAEGAILAHSHSVPGGRLRKGHPLTPADLARLAEAGETEVVVARLDPGDLGEDEAAAAIGAALLPDGGGQGLRASKAVTGRVNLIATRKGVLDLDPEAVAALNGVDPAITFATLPRYARVGEGVMIGTVKIISYGVAEAAVLRAARPAGIVVRPALWPKATLIETRIGAGDPEKGEAAIRGRLDALGVELASVVQVPHRLADVTEAVAAAEPGGIVLILTASATSDPADIGPEAVRRAGGSVTRFGMPVDPGNLLFLGQQGGRPVIGLPGCARSPAPNGADMVLDRVACGIEVSGADIAAMGVGGLLKETKARGRPRAG